MTAEKRVAAILASLDGGLPEQLDLGLAMRLAGIAYMTGYEDGTVARSEQDADHKIAVKT